MENFLKKKIGGSLGNHYQIQQPLIFDKITSKVYVETTSNIDNFILENIFEKLKLEGFTDLYVIDIEFVKQAIIEKSIRNEEES